MKPFNLEKAKAGARLCTREGIPARIICYDAEGDYPIVALIKYHDDGEVPSTYNLDGKLFKDMIVFDDLMLADDND